MLVLVLVVLEVLETLKAVLGGMSSWIRGSICGPALSGCSEGVTGHGWGG